MNFIEELYYGNINPNEKQYGNTGICTCDLISMLIILKKSE